MNATMVQAVMDELAGWTLEHGTVTRLDAHDMAEAVVRRLDQEQERLIQAKANLRPMRRSWRVKQERYRDVFDWVGTDGRILRTHGPTECMGPQCSIHNPSGHPLKDAPLHWRSDKGLMERICKHGVGHDDPDDIAYRRLMGYEASGIHGCCGCCSEGVKHGQAD